MDEAWLTVWVLAVVFLATLIRSAFGFGEALIAVPLLALIVSVEVAAPLAVLLSVVVAAAVMFEDWHRVHFASAWRLVLATLAGIPFGLLLLTEVPEPVVKAVLAIVIITFSVYCLARTTPPTLHDDRLSWLFGFVAGVLGGAYGINGPPLVVYASLRRWSAAQFRATLQAYFLPASAVGLVGYWMTGVWGSEVNRYFVLSLPVAGVSILLGRAVHRRMTGVFFLRYVHIALVVTGIALLVQALAQQAAGRSPVRATKMESPALTWRTVHARPR
jgi:uncharacterized membrane protein YfcA